MPIREACTCCGTYASVRVANKALAAGSLGLCWLLSELYVLNSRRRTFEMARSLPMSSTTTAKTIKQIFSAYGLPEQLVTDNGPQFISEEFSLFTQLNGIKHIHSAPYHPATNGLAERFVRSFKMALKASVGSGRPLSEQLCSLLVTYRSTPHATTGVALCSLFLHCHIRTRQDQTRSRV